MNILMLCYYFPPISDVGSKRSVAFSTYFNKYGWKPFVISVKNPDKNYCSIGNEPPPEGVRVEYSYCIANLYKFVGQLNGVFSRLLKPFNITLKRNYFYDLFCIPDHFCGWIPLTITKGIGIIRKCNIDVIYVSCSPFSSSIIGLVLKFLTRKPLIIDFRDPLVIKNVPYLKTPMIRNSINIFIEDLILKYSDIFVVTTEELRKAYLERYPLKERKIFTVHNGFDISYLIAQKPDKFKKFSIIYIGQFYFCDNRNDKYTDAFFQSISLLKSNGKINADNFQFLYFGDGIERIERIARDLDIEDLVICSERKPYKDILEFLSKSHLQLLRIIKPMISTKLYEGIPFDIPFLATIPHGEVEEIISKYSPASYVITESSASKVADAILDAIGKYRCNQIKGNYIEEFLSIYSRENLTRKLIRIIDDNIES